MGDLRFAIFGTGFWSRFQLAATIAKEAAWAEASVRALRQWVKA